MHFHLWKDTVWNRYGIAVEQSCRCGAKRHHFRADLKGAWPGKPQWRDGAHPNRPAEKQA